MSAVIYAGAAADGLSAVPLPVSLAVSLNDVGARVRNAAGTAAVSPVRRGVRTLKATWKGLSAAEAQALLGTLSLDRFFMKYPDPVCGAWRTAEFFCVKREAELRYAENGAAVIETLSAVCEEV